jgi:hypothetical protein
VFNNQPEKDTQKFKLFFQKENRRQGEHENFDLIETCRYAFHDLNNNFKEKLFSKIANAEEHPFLIEIETQSTKSVDTPKISCDQIFASYVIENFHLTNRDYFAFVVRFVTLFRECINQFRHGSDPNVEYTLDNGADTVPDLCNEFITEFMENNDNFGLDTTEVIEIIQQFCNWLYESKFTTSRLTLLG